MEQLNKYLTITALAATLALPAATSSASGSPTRGTGSGSKVGPTSVETSQVREGRVARPLPYSVWIRRTGGPTARLWQSVNIFTDGQWTYAEWGHHQRGRLGLWERRWLGQVMLDPALPGSLGYHPAPFGCADAFRYHVWWSDHSHPESTFTDCGNPPTPLARLVHAVMDLTAF